MAATRFKVSSWFTPPSWLLLALLVTSPAIATAEPRTAYDSTDVWISAAAGGALGTVAGLLIGAKLGGDRETESGLSTPLGALLGALVGNAVGAPLGVAAYEAVNGVDGSLVSASAGSFSGLALGLALGVVFCIGGEGGCLLGVGVLLVAPATGAAIGYDGSPRRLRTAGALLNADGGRIAFGVPAVTAAPQDGALRYSLTLAAGRF